jgi:uncharacterized protein Yka (UPF0111/DUF47 family)
MTATLGLERLPRPIAALLQEGAANLLTVANELDALVHGDVSALGAIVRSEDNGDRIVHDLIAAAGESWRIGPDRARLILLAEAVDDVVDALQTLAWSWPHPPRAEFTDLLLALRDAARDVGHAVAAVEREHELRAWLSRCREHEQEIRRLSRAARAWLLVAQRDPQLAIRGHDLLGHADAAQRACTRLRVRLDSHALT